MVGGRRGQLACHSDCSIYLPSAGGVEALQVRPLRLSSPAIARSNRRNRSACGAARLDCVTSSLCAYYTSMLIAISHPLRRQGAAIRLGTPGSGYPPGHPPLTHDPISNQCRTRRVAVQEFGPTGHGSASATDPAMRALLSIVHACVTPESRAGLNGADLLSNRALAWRILAAVLACVGLAAWSGLGGAGHGGALDPVANALMRCACRPCIASLPSVLQRGHRAQTAERQVMSARRIPLRQCAGRGSSGEPLPCRADCGAGEDGGVYLIGVPHGESGDV
jgi:hypothetical protein